MLLWFNHTALAAMLLCKYTAGGVTALNEIHTTHLHHSVMIATCTWLVSTASRDATVTIHKRNTNIQEFCTLLNPLLVIVTWLVMVRHICKREILLANTMQWLPCN